jgi:hypothetical protein
MERSLERAETRISSPQQQHRNTTSLPLLWPPTNYELPPYEMPFSATVPMAMALQHPQHPQQTVELSRSASPSIVSDSGHAGFQTILNEQQPTQECVEDGIDLRMIDQEPRPVTQQQHQMPRLSELRRLSINLPPAPNSRPGPQPPTMVIHAMTEFLSTVFTIQAETVGLSSAIADYLAWTIMLPDMDGRSAEVLKILEARLHEMKQVSEVRFCSAYQRMCASVERFSEWSQPLKRLETEFQETLLRTSRFFLEKYHIEQPLSEQQSR